MEPERGKPGKTILGRYLDADNGKDLDINSRLGKNVYVDTDGKTICASIDGQVVLNGEKISIEPVFVVEGDVTQKIGNIDFVGTVIVKGNVDGYDIKATGNIEIEGNGFLSSEVIKSIQSLGVGAMVKSNNDSYLITNAQRSIFEYFSIFF